VGLPLAVRTTGLVHTAQTVHCTRFAQRLSDAAPSTLRVWLCDEQGTSADARAQLADSGVSAPRAEALEDSVAACLILTNYFTQRAGRPRLVEPAAGYRKAQTQRLLEDPATAQLRWLGESDGARVPAAAHAWPSAAPKEPPPPAMPRKAVPLRLLRRQHDAPGAARRQQYEEMGL